MKPIISIIVPIYNVEKYLPKCIESILNQSFTELELILVNDGSLDNSGKICDDYSTKDNRIKVIHKKNGGVSSARNAGVNEALGEYIGFVDPDDYIDKEMYQKLYGLCKSNKADIAICDLGREINGKIINEEKDESILELNNIEGMRELFKGKLYRFSLCNKLYNKECFNGVIFPEGRIHEDLSTTYKLFAKANKCIYINYNGYIYVKRENSILTSKYSEKRLQSFIGWDEIIKFISENYNELLDQVIETFTYWCIDNVMYVINQTDDKNKEKEYLKYIQRYMRKYYNFIIKNSRISKSYKGRVTILNMWSTVFFVKRNVSKKCS